ncbi:MAG: thioredoxin family protein [Chloroflexota bacterium]|nr:thioredoxin family protein [Chloroflexota bacterium]MDQ5866192.1 thioredoxin family protein [Chloroflexota bacterium]
MDTLTRVDSDRFSEGLTVEEYVPGMRKNRALFEQNYDNVALRDEDVRFLAEGTKVSKVLVLAEDWCGDAIRYVPVVARLADEIPSWELRIFYRDENPDLAENWKKHGLFRAIPVIVFFDEQFNELAHFIEKPSPVYHAEDDARDRFAAENPDLPDARLPVDRMSPTTLDRYTTFIRSLRADSQRRWQQHFIDEIKVKLAS